MKFHTQPHPVPQLFPSFDVTFTIENAKEYYELRDFMKNNLFIPQAHKEQKGQSGYSIDTAIITKFMNDCFHALRAGCHSYFRDGS